MLLRRGHVSMAQDTLDNIVRNPQLGEVGRQAAAERMPAMPLDTRLLQIGLDLAFQEIVHPDRLLSAGGGEHPALGGRAYRLTVLPQHLVEARDDRDGCET